MSAGPPLPVDLWDSLSPEARALIRTLQAEATDLRTKVRALQQQVHDLPERLNQNPTKSKRAIARLCERLRPNDFCCKKL
jgi:uncharacterized protein YlxW (UPF0749 family)